MKKRDSHKSGGRGVAMPPPSGGAMRTAPRPENDTDEAPPIPHGDSGERSIPPQQPGGEPVVYSSKHAKVAGSFSDSEGGRDSGAQAEGVTSGPVRNVPHSLNAAATKPALYTVAMSYISLIVKLEEMDALTFREIEKQVMKDKRLTDFERKTCIIPLLDARWRYLAMPVEARR